MSHDDDARDAWFAALDANDRIGAQEAAYLLGGWDASRWFAQGTRLMVANDCAEGDAEQLADFAGYRGAVLCDDEDETAPEHANDPETQCDQMAAAIAASALRALKSVVVLTAERDELARLAAVRLADAERGWKIAAENRKRAEKAERALAAIAALAAQAEPIKEEVSRG